MAVLSIPEMNFQTNDVTSIRAFFVERNIFFDQWSCDVEFQNSATQEEILSAYNK